MRIEPSNEDSSLLGEEWPTQDYRLPDQSSVTLDVQSDTRISEWSYFWLTFGSGGARPAWYRVFEKGKKPPQWQPLKSVAQIVQETGVEDDEEDDDDPAETRREREGKVGAAEKLPAGQYRFQVKIGGGDKEYELTGIEFKVKPAPPKPTPKPGEVQVSLTQPRCNASAAASLIKLPKLAVRALGEVARPMRFNGGPEFKIDDLYSEFLQLHGRPAAEYPWPGIMLVTLLPYLQEKHQITLMKSEHDKVTQKITEGRKAPQYIFTNGHRQAFLAKLGGQFSEQAMREFFREYNGMDDPEAGKKMLEGIRALHQGLSTLDENSVILFSIGFPPEHRAFLDAARTGNIEKVRELLAHGVPVDVRDDFCTHYPQNEQTALMYAAGGGHLEVVRSLLKAGASVTAVDKMAQEDGGEQTALHYAASHPNVTVGEELLNAGADPNALTKSVWKPGYTPLICALRAGHRDVARLLIQRGTKRGLKIEGKQTYSPLCAALEAQRAQVPAETIRDLVLLLLEAGADPNGVSRSNRTALFDLVTENRDSYPTGLPEQITNLLVGKLLEAGSKPDWIDELGCTPLHNAVLYQKEGAVELLLDAGADINRSTPRGTVLDIVENDIAKCEKRLLELPTSPPVSRGAADPKKQLRAELEEKLRRDKEIEKILRRFGAKRKA